MRNLTAKELEQLKAKGVTKSFHIDHAVTLDIELPEGQNSAFFDLDGNFLTHSIVKADRKHGREPLVYYNPPTDPGKAFIYQF